MWVSNELLIARGTPPNPGGEFLLQAPHKWPISSRGLEPALFLEQILQRELHDPRIQRRENLAELS